MNVWLRRSLQTAVIAGGFVALGTGAAQAHGVGNDNQVDAPVLAVTNVSDNAVATAGIAKAGGAGSHASESAAPMSSRKGGHGSHGVGNDNQVNVPVLAVTNVSDNAVAAAGIAKAGGSGSHAPSESAATKANRDGGHGSHGIGNNNVVNVPVLAVTNVSDNAVAAFGIAKAGGSDASTMAAGHRSAREAGSNNAVDAPVVAVTDVTRNAVGGSHVSVPSKPANTDLSRQTAGIRGGHGHGGGILNDNKVNAPIIAITNVSDNAIAVFGWARAGK